LIGDAIFWKMNLTLSFDFLSRVGKKLAQKADKNKHLKNTSHAWGPDNRKIEVSFKTAFLYQLQ